MAGLFDTLRNLGGAHLQHVTALREALQTPDMQTARDRLAQYLQGLSGPALAGFRVSLGMVAASETQPQVQQALQWIAANVDGLREGRFKAVTPATLPPHGLTLEQVSTLITPWAQMTPEQARPLFFASLQALDARGRQEFAAHLETLATQVQWQMQQTAQQDDNTAWGTSYEDRIAYMQARFASGEPSQKQQALAQQQAMMQTLLQMAQAARQWQPPAAPAAAPEPALGSSMLTQLQQLFEQEKTKGMDPARVAALTDAMQRLGGVIGRMESRPGLGPDASIEERRADLQRSMAEVAALRGQAEEMREMAHHVRRTQPLPAGSRAAAIAPLVDALVDMSAGLMNRPQASRRETEAAALQDLHLSMVKARARLAELAPKDDDVLNFERDALRQAAQALRLFQRRGHLMLARPVWPGAAARVEPGSALFAGPAAVKAVVRAACTDRRLSLRPTVVPGVDTATALWRAAQGAGLAVLDLSDGDPQTYYQLGLAYALGTELLLLARRGTALPFDVAQAVLEYSDPADLATQLPAALDAALYGVQTLGLSLLMHGGLQRCRDLAARAVGSAHAGVLLKQLEEAAASPLDFRAALEQFVGDLGNSRLLLLHPRWPAHYPAADARRCFVVMPFARQLEATQALYRALDADLAALGAEVVRGDEALGQEIVASIWEETARASHVLVDLTGYNLNVCLELGMADAMGRDTLLIGTEGTADRRFAAIDKRRIHMYRSGDDEAVRAQVRAFVQRAPTLL